MGYDLPDLLDESEFPDTDSFFSLFRLAARVEENGGSLAFKGWGGVVKVLSVSRTSSGFSVTTTTFGSLEQYAEHRRMLALIEHEFKKNT